MQLSAENIASLRMQSSDGNSYSATRFFREENVVLGREEKTQAQAVCIYALSSLIM
jgi:hypothetical protein